ncbi:MAG: AMIN domain-containing protein [Campylobacterales bacterium]|nr:AMIN domain-containing protein [Campylobacterales bacterium]
MRHLLLLLLSLGLQARENPFFASESVDVPQTTANVIAAYPPLKRVAMSFPDQARVLEEVSITYKNLDGTLETQKLQVQQSIDWHLPLFISQSYVPATDPAPIKTASKETVNFQTITLHVSPNGLEIVTKDRLIRHFLMVSPHRIVLDFEREADFLSYEKTLSTLPFMQVRFGNHKGFYRAVVTLDGRYRYSLEPNSSGVRITIL